MGNELFDKTLMGNTPEHIKGIVCNVKNCVYHDKDSYCTAQRVCVGPGYASSCTDTVCATFKMKN